MNDNNIALSFDTAEYYSLLEACDYLNRKYKTDNLTPKKLLKQIYSRKINAFVHFCMDELSKQILRFQVESYGSNIFTKEIYELHKGELEPLIEKVEQVETIISNRLIDGLSMGLVLFRIYENSLFNMSLSSKSNNESRLLLLDGFVYMPNINDDPSKPSQLSEWKVNKDGNEYFFTEIGAVTLVIDSTNDDDLAEFSEKSPFLCSFDKRDDFSFPELNIKLNDIIVLHKDLLILEKEILNNKSIKDKSKFETRKGISHKKILAKEFAKHVADEHWKQDIENQIKIGEMCEIVWAKLLDSSFDKELPEHRENLKPWIKEVAPSYASEAGRPKS